MEQHRLKFIAANGYPSACNLTVYRDIQLVIASETDEGVSRSAGAVTNAAEVIGYPNHENPDVTVLQNSSAFGL